MNKKIIAIMAISTISLIGITENSKAQTFAENPIFFLNPNSIGGKKGAIQYSEMDEEAKLYYNTLYNIIGTEEIIKNVMNPIFTEDFPNYLESINQVEYANKFRRIGNEVIKDYYYNEDQEKIDWIEYISTFISPSNLKMTVKSAGGIDRFKEIIKGINDIEISIQRSTAKLYFKTEYRVQKQQNGSEYSQEITEEYINAYKEKQKNSKIKGLYPSATGMFSYMTIPGAIVAANAVNDYDKIDSNDKKIIVDPLRYLTKEELIYSLQSIENINKIGLQKNKILLEEDMKNKKLEQQGNKSESESSPISKAKTIVVGNTWSVWPKILYKYYSPYEINQYINK